MLDGRTELHVYFNISLKFCSIEAALSVFGQMRPPGIYKQDYVNELFLRYGDSEDTPSAPPMPDWCLGQCRVCRHRSAIQCENLWWK